MESALKPRSPKSDLPERIWQALLACPGLTVYDLARQLNVSRSAVSCALITLENSGRLLTDDGYGHLDIYRAEIEDW